MDAGFTAFVFLVAILVAAGGTLLLVGYVTTLPASFCKRLLQDEQTVGVAGWANKMTVGRAIIRHG